jgi:hypothetical protein
VPAEDSHAVARIVVHLHVGSDRMAATDDPVFLGLEGPHGREFRMALAEGRSMRRKGTETYVFGPEGGAEVNVARPELNDPTRPPIDVAGVTGVYLEKRLDPIPNVRGVAELDDRLQIEEVSVELHAGDGGAPRRFHRVGPIWLGLTCGLRCAVPPSEDA